MAFSAEQDVGIHCHQIKNIMGHGSVTLRHGPEAEALGLKYSAGIWLTHDKEVYENLGSNCVIKFGAMSCGML